MGLAGASGPYRHQVRMRRSSVWGLHGPSRRRSRLRVPDDAGGSRRPNRDHDRRPVSHRRACAAARLDRGAGAAMRLLPVRPDHAGGRAPQCHPAPDAPGDRRHDVRQPVPVRHLSAHREGYRARGAGGLSDELHRQPLAPRLSRRHRRAGLRRPGGRDTAGFPWRGASASRRRDAGQCVGEHRPE
ncbi:hypothetical protein BCEN4_1740012 [Burkholderia cenocepacia]|nr:hypothetical protein BCEN4_1740012 [Burkholderia cenocepacia]